MAAPPDQAEIVAALVRLGLIEPGAAVALEPLSGGVSSDIFRVETAGATFCVKRALAKLKVAQDWRAPVERSKYEWAWLETAAALVPDAVPRLLGFDEQANLFALEWLAPGDHRWWKGELHAGRADESEAVEVGRRLGLIHSGTADRSEIAARFPTDHIFHAIRLEPYLLATASAHPDLGQKLEDLVAITARTKRALVHGDVSPKNILIGPRGPVFLDAECAWYGDPAFDVTFCLNHLLLKALWTPEARLQFAKCFHALASAYLDQVSWEPADAIEQRTAHLLPGLMLARVDGKSPAEYITHEEDKARVRRVARRLLMEPVSRLAAIQDVWTRELNS
jgi:aminoglycoside phosphotransferase (APT) family kinase protein